VKAKEQDHQYTLAELDEAIGDDDSDDDNGPEYYFIDREVIRILQCDFMIRFYFFNRRKKRVTMRMRKKVLKGSVKKDITSTTIFNARCLFYFHS
jgi:hypothetical protein